LESSGIAVTASYAVQQSSRLLKVCDFLHIAMESVYANVPKQNIKGAERDELLVLQERLQSKIKVCKNF
jgi:hypothetical protein